MGSISSCQVLSLVVFVEEENCASSLYFEVVQTKFFQETPYLLWSNTTKELFAAYFEVLTSSGTENSCTTSSGGTWQLIKVAFDAFLGGVFEVYFE